MVAAALVAIALVSGLLLEFQVRRHSEQIRFQGRSLVRLLQKLSFEELVRGNGQQRPLDAARHAQGQPDFAYVAIIDLDGRVHARLLAAGTALPDAPIGPEPASWNDERVLSPEGSTPVREFLAPVMEQGRVRAHLRVGFFDPGYSIIGRYAPLLAAVALPVFLLVPACYWLLRREIEPLSSASQRIQMLLETRVPGETATQPEGGLSGGLDQLIDETRRRIDDAEKEKSGTLASSKVLSYQKARLEAALDTLPDGVLLLDGDGLVNLANLKVQGVLGVAPAQIVGRRAEQWCRNPELLKFLVRYEDAASRPRRAERMEMPLGEGERTLSVTSYPLVQGQNRPECSGTLVALRDTQSERAERGRQAEFLSHVAHELKSPLNVLGMYGEMIGGDDGMVEAFRVEASNVIRDEVERLSGLINTLMSVARIESGSVTLDRQRVRLPEFLRDAIEVAARSPRAAGLNFDLVCPADVSAIFVDKHLLRVAVDNLLTNAVKYNSEGGDVAVAVSENDTAILVQVRDTGIGIAEEEVPKIFEKFFRSADKEAQERGGHGLGLTLARQIVELHGARIGVKSIPGEGTRFAIQFPKTPALIQETLK